MEFIKRCLSIFEDHEIMIPDRILPEHIKAMYVTSQEIKQQIISHLRESSLIQTLLDGRETINGILVDEFIRTEDVISPDLVKDCL
jgi:hypothetical protein